MSFTLVMQVFWDFTLKSAIEGVTLHISPRVTQPASSANIATSPQPSYTIEPHRKAAESGIRGEDCATPDKAKPTTRT